MNNNLDAFLNNKPTVLLVDDEEDFAKIYVPIWQKRTGLGFIYARDAKTAIDIVKHYPIKVAILDQLMPTPGTELIKQLKNIDYQLKTILLSAELKDHMYKATRVGFDYSMMKDEVDNIPQIVLEFHSKYNNELKSKICTSIGNIYAIKTISYSIIDFTIIEEERVADKWHTDVYIRTGQELTNEAEIDIEQEFKFSNDFLIENENSLNFSNEMLAAFKTSLTLKMEAAFGLQYTEKVKEVFKRTNRYCLPSDSPNIVSRSYEYAKMAREVKLYIKKYCSCCKEISIIPITVMIPIPVIKQRIIEHYNDNRKIIIDAGEIR